MSAQAYVVIMAGGSGTRFWPLSRRTRPKQLLSLVTSETLLEETLSRVVPDCVPDRRVLIVTGEHLRAATVKAVGSLGVRVVVEPMARNTAPCIALAAALVAHESPEAVISVLAADHHIADPEGFRRVFRQAQFVARTGKIVTVGIRPDRPETGYGYVRQGAALEDGAFAVDAFVEKPDLDTAKGYLSDGRYLWNSGMFFMRADVLLAAVDKHLPGLSRGIKGYQKAIGTRDEPAALRACFEQAESISIDYGVMEKEVGNITVIPADFGWSDVGSWRTLLDFRGAGEENFVRGSATVVDSRGSVIVSTGPHIAVVGVEGMAVVATEDAVLVVPLERAQAVGVIPRKLAETDRGDLV